MTNSQDFRYVSDMWRFSPGTVIDDRFEIVSNAVRRSFSTLFLADDLEQSVRKALLFIPKTIKDEPEALAYIQEQTQLIRWLEHPMIARLYEFHVGPRYAYFEMEDVPGKSLNQKKLEHPQKRLSENIVRWLGVQILDALEYAHNNNVLHRDIKPKNVVLTPDGKVKLIDVGISETLRASTSLIWDTTPQTTILYMSPEQLQGRQIGIPADIYSVGATLYDLINGRAPFFTGDVYTQILREQPKPVPHASADLNNILLKSLSKNPDFRYQNCARMKKELAQPGYQFHSQKGGPQAASAPAPRKKTSGVKSRRSAVRRRNPSIKYLLGTMLILVLAIYMFSKLGNLTKPATQPAPADTLVRQTQPAAPDSFRMKMLHALVSQADRQFEQKHFLRPIDASALDLYVQARKIAPHDQHIHKRLRILSGKLEEALKTEIATGTLAGARVLLERAQRSFSGDERWQSYAGQVEALSHMPLRLAILNGNGKKGIAKELAAKLQSRGFSVVYTENYRRKGRIYWRVKKTFLAGKPFRNLKIKGLEEKLHLTYRRNTSLAVTNAEVTAVLVLGRDYRKILNSITNYE